MSCWCFEFRDISRSFTTKAMIEPGTKAKAITMKSTLVMFWNRVTALIAPIVGGSGAEATVIEVPSAASALLIALSATGSTCRAVAFTSTARAGKHQFWPLSVLRAHTEPSYRTDLLRSRLTAPGGSGRETVGEAASAAAAKKVAVDGRESRPAARRSLLRLSFASGWPTWRDGRHWGVKRGVRGY